MKTALSPNDADGAVERWLSEVESLMFASVHKSMAEAMKAYSTTERDKWVLQWPGQVVLGVSQVYWTSEVATAMQDSDKSALKAYLDLSNERLKDIVSLVRGNLSSLERKTLGALVVIDVHARDTLAQLVASNVRDTRSFEWTSQLRYYWEDGTIKVCISFRSAVFLLTAIYTSRFA
jgi:dynein heavy chain